MDVTSVSVEIPIMEFPDISDILVDAISNALEVMTEQIFAMISAVLPYALAVLGVLTAVIAGLRIFQRVIERDSKNEWVAHNSDLRLGSDGEWKCEAERQFIAESRLYNFDEGYYEDDGW
jgi:hypothetical protein